MSRSLVLLLGRHSLQSLVPATLISQVESLLDNHRIQNAVDLADQERRRQLYGGVRVDEAEVEQLHYIYQRIGFQCFQETLFEDAGKHLFDGELDARILVSYFPSLRGTLGRAKDYVNMFTGVAEHVPSEPSVEEIIAANLVRNYSPHLAPNTREAPSTAELRKILHIAAEDMLEAFLRKCRTRRVLDNQSDESTLTLSDEYAVVDTVLVKLFAKSEKTKDLYALLHETHHVVLSEVESVLVETGQYNALSVLYQHSGEDEKLLEVWAKIIDQEWTDEDIPDPIGNMVTHITKLIQSKPPAHSEITRKWALWLMQEKRDPESGLKLLVSSRSPSTTRASGKRRHPQNNKSVSNLEELDAGKQDQELLVRIREVNPGIVVQYLEYLILQLGIKTREIHVEYAMSCINGVLDYLKNTEVERLWRAKAASYFSSSSANTSPSSLSSTTPLPFVSYFASTTPDSPSKRARIKTLLFLQTSGLYDASIIKEKILGVLATTSEGAGSSSGSKAKHKPLILGLELAILESKLGNHHAVLECLVRDVGDSASAEAYCTSGIDREVIPARIRRTITESTEGLNDWKDTVIAVGKTGTEQAGLTNDGLLKMLLEVLMVVSDADKEASSGSRSELQPHQIQVSRLLDSQGVHLDVCDVIQTIPSSWPLNLLSSFVARSCRRTLHTTHEGQIVKMLTLAENWDVKERTWAVLREEGFVVEESVEGEGGNDSESKGRDAVDVVLNEKSALLSSSDPPSVDVLPDSEGV
ncbi:hypothetical protein BDP27DRAFT_1445084 [Rhodocollybia butyracea]|uniref:Vacuolar sorting protein 39/Transforming growth factor beta receptor-associated domain-containing protein n=1 Tax=Rhodocollybia butyracea TaxID=206335 RepID=A0A9P5Q2E2_9AGAR|nr:hypothetical protein BDP27DRAFT_1445084 [Rhodocollybia butyracea]